MSSRSSRSSRGSRYALVMVSIILKPWCIKGHPLHQIWRMGPMTISHFAHHDMWYFGIHLRRGRLHAKLLDVAWEGRPGRGH